jgi:hypothetical protein
VAERQQRKEVGPAQQELNVRTGPLRGGARARAAAAVSCALALAGACTDGGDRFTAHVAQVESRVEGDVDVHHAWFDDATLVTLAPFHAAAGRNTYTRGRLDELLGPGHLYASLAIWRFGGNEALAPGADGIPVAASAGPGRVAALAPSKWLAKVGDGAARSLLATLAGAGTLPTLAAGQELQLLLVFPTDEPFGALTDVHVTLGGREFALTRGKATAVAWDEFRSQPAKGRFEVAIGLKPPAKPTDGDEGHGEREGDR